LGNAGVFCYNNNQHPFFSGKNTISLVHLYAGLPVNSGIIDILFLFSISFSGNGHTDAKPLFLDCNRADVF